ncbi:hypothetical protein FE783_15075 [Paenibacillus mesophilus]|uniref:hypothetical protein n=1 Tax=Paenibacillus mesophilus TaxID=2582849 RepID=UPI00110DB76F|nr:hypothetical protein [Paenibacillus mesophilus]TMV48992.1 hypothetical protein FE783_15075 [Paenibacillus mesophilus]
MANIKVLMWFDVEDYITPEAQDAWAGILRVLHEKRVPGIFKIVGEKARITGSRQRQDILRGLTGHEIGYHSDMHSVHPVSTEYLEHMGFREGAVEFEKRERDGFADVRTITGSPVVCYGQAGYSWAPQTFAALRKWGVPVYLDDHDQIAMDGRPFWYGGLLNFTRLTATMHLSFDKGGAERTYANFDRLYEQLADEPVGFISMYCHDCDFVCQGFWDAVNFAKGKQTPREEWRPAPLKPPGELEQELERFGEFIDYALSKGQIEFITAQQALRLESSQPGTVPESDVRRLAATVDRELGFRELEGKCYSASELHSLFAALLLGRELTPRLAYGPEREIASEVAGGKLRVADIKKALAESGQPDVLGFSQLPDCCEIDGRKVSVLDLTCTMAGILNRRLHDDDTVELVQGVLTTSRYAADNELWGPRWCIFPEHFPAPNIVNMSKLQTWTLKPALFAGEAAR